MVTSAEPAHATGRHFADSHTAKNIASASPTINAQTARPTVIPAALAKGKNSFIRNYFWNHLL
ncbi:Uncharacterised protein [Shigella sonnei]|nr:hypothetical protein [Klebsiella pneumoniae IS22]CSG33016.1 Uncharacterised protein [Shigella sonnei]CSP48770.1 Uncharacterised protein [Shigella sonnei]CSP86470.1 Uncharacterised protein [Shigella sonnei]CSR45339.1 Uncharacterised protein [Shigella sonnei]